MNYWLMKSEPYVFSIDDLRQVGVTGWEGVRNYQARNHMKAMKRGDLAFFYHSNASPSEIVGMMRIEREAYPDPTQFSPTSEYFDPASKQESPRWFQVDVRFVSKFPNPMTLDQIRKERRLRDMILIRHGRLSVQPVTPSEWRFILSRCE